MTTSSISPGATSTGLQVSAGLIWQVLAGGSAVGTLISAGGSLEISAGGLATATSVGSGGGEYVLAGGVASLTVVNSGGAEFLSGGSAFSATLASGGSQYILSGAVAAATRVFSGATEFVSAGSAFGTVLSGGGFQRVASGGLASGTVASADTYIFVSSGGVASAATADSGGIAYVTGGSAVSITLASSGFAYIVFGGQTTGTIVGAHATAFVSSGGIDSSAGVGGAEYVAAGGSAIAATVDGGGYLEVDAGGTATSAAILASGVAVVASGGVASGATISAGGAALVLSGGSAAHATVESGGLLVVLSGGGATGTTLDPGGMVSSAAIVLQTPDGVSAFASPAGPVAVASGDTLYVATGGLARGVALAGGEIVQGGTTTATAIVGGSESVDAGGVVSRSSVGVGGVERVSSGGVAVGTMVTSGGGVLISQGGIVSGLTVGAGGSGAVFAGGSAVAATIDTSGLLVLSSGGAAYGDIVLSGGGATLAIAGLTPPDVPISGFSAGDMIDLTDVAGASATLNTSTDVLTVSAGGAVYSAQLVGSYSAGISATAVTDGGSGTDISLACFAAGTLIATPEGAMPVETLAPGRLVLTRDGRAAPVRWVGRRHVDCRRHPRPDSVRPVRIAADAFAPGQPRRDLLLSPDHAVFVAGVLIPVRYLVNGATVAPLAVDGIAYLHVELDRHDVILAEGLPAESFLDTGNRAAFANGGGATALHPDFARRVWHADACADLVIAGAPLAQVRRRLLARAASLGHGTTRDPALEPWADGRRLAAEVEGTHWRVRLGSAATVTLRSRTWVPGWLEAGAGDMRTLGVAVGRLELDGRALPLASPRLGAGWHANERHWRWTNGAANFDVAGADELGFAVAIRGRYWRQLAGSGAATAESAG